MGVLRLFRKVLWECLMSPGCPGAWEHSQGGDCVPIIFLFPNPIEHSTGLGTQEGSVSTG